ncbi:hypothetical protein Tco_0704989 [Tanacetum coccineum]|uniref:Uncharacterized protein n=1 Tax=Tanacetum coccineum TaxID=301880 RepID=A0ABQ4Y3B0_9ASTR
MKRAGKDFSGRITPLFDTMMVQPVEEMGEDSDHPTDSTHIPIIDQPSSSSQPKKKQPSKKAQRQEAEVPQDEAEHEESVPTPSNDPQPSGEDSMQLTELMVLCTKLQTQVLDLQKAKDAQAKEIAALKKRIQRLERRKMSRPTGESLGAPEDASKQGRSIKDIDTDVDVSLVDETQERQNDDLMFDSGVLEDDVMHVEAKVDGKIKHEKAKGEGRSVERKEKTKGSKKMMLRRKRAGKEQQQESSKKQKVKKEKESDKVDEVDEAELKKLLVIKKDEDIAIDAIPLATKLPVIIDYKLHKEGMMVHYQLIRADGSSKRYSSMIRMLQGIDREDLEALWRIVKAKYGDTRPENEFERVLWGDLKVMFEPDIKSDIWRMLQGYRKMNIKFRGGLLGLKRLHGFLEVTTAQVHNGNYAKWFGINKWYQSFALRNFDLEDMELESTNSGPTAKLPILKLGEYEISKTFMAQVIRVHVLDFDGLTEEMRVTFAVRLRMVYTGDEGQELMSDTKLRLDEADTLCFQLGGARHSMTWRQFILH